MHKATSLTTMIESNCECLNHIRKCIRIEDQLERDRLPMVDSYQQKAN